MTDGPPPAPPPLAHPSPRRLEAEAALRTGWARGAAAAAIAFLLLYGLNVLITVVQQTYGPEAIEFQGRTVDTPQASLADVPQGALASMYVWHGVTFVLELGGTLAEDSPIPGGFGVSFSVALILGTFVVAWALFLAGRHLVRAAPVPLWLQPLRWVQVALPYSLLALFLSPLARLAQSVPVPGTAGVSGTDPAVSITPTAGSVLLMTFLLAIVAAGAGGVGAVRDSLAPALRRVVGAVAGGWRMLWLAVALAVLGFLVVAALHPEPTRAYLEFVSAGGALGIIRGAILTMFLLGNVGVYVAAAATGTAIGVSGFGASCTVLSYLSFPRGVLESAPAGGGFADPCGSLPLDVGPAPAPYLLFLLVPLVATILGGRRAAVHAGARTAGMGAAVGAAASAPFAILFVVFAALADISYEVQAFIRLSVAIGPVLILLFLLALAWGAAGGAIGGWLGSRSGAAPRLEESAAFEPEPGTTNGPGVDPGPS